MYAIKPAFTDALRVHKTYPRRKRRRPRLCLPSRTSQCTGSASLGSSWPTRSPASAFLRPRRRTWHLWFGTVHEKIAPLIYYKNVIKMHHVCIAITSQRLTLSTSYFHHFILHHFSAVKCILESWTISVSTFLRAIPPGVQNYHIFV